MSEPTHPDPSAGTAGEPPKLDLSGTELGKAQNEAVSNPTSKAADRSTSAADRTTEIVTDVSDEAVSTKSVESQPATDKGLTPEKSVDADKPQKGGVGRRVVGMLALLLSLLGILASLGIVGLSFRVLFGATDTASGALEPVVASVDRLETRIDQTDDRIGLRDVDAADMPELVARTNGLADVAIGASDVIAAVDEHPVYRYLPTGLGELSDDIDVYRETALSVDRSVAAASSLSASAATDLGGQVDELQARVTGTRGLVDDARSSLARWIRLASLGGVILGLWSLWGQFALLRRGGRGLLGRPV